MCLRMLPAISVQAKDSSGAIIIPKVGMDGPRGGSLLFGVPHGMKALHIEATHIPAGVVVISARDAGGTGLGNVAAGQAGPVEIWLRPGWYQETNCDLQWTHNVSLRGTSSHREDTVLDCKGGRRHMEFQGVSVVGRMSNMMLVNGFAHGDGGCILVTDASLHLESVDFQNCISAGSSEASRVWKRGRGFGGAVAMVSSACKDDPSWRDSEGLGCDAYMPMVMDFLIMPYNPGPSQTPDPAPALARNRCARAKTLANADGTDASTACCSCKWVTPQQNLYSTKCLVTSNDDLTTHSQQTCYNPGDQCVTATSATMTVYQCSTPAAALGFDCATAPGTASAFGMDFTYSCCTAVDGVACNDPQQNLPSSRRSGSVKCLQTTSGSNAVPFTCPNPSDKCVAMAVVPVEADFTIYFCESVAVFFGLNQSPCSALSLSLPPTIPAMLGDRVQYAGTEWIPTCCEGFMCNDPNKPTGFLRLPGGSLTMVNVKISSCTAKIGGGAVAVVSEGPRSNVGTVNITKTVISHCAAALGGGGVLILSMLNGVVGAIDLSHLVVSDCSASPESGSAGFAGGIGVIALSESIIDSVDFSELTVSRCNSTTGAGGMLLWAEERGAVGSVQVHRSKVESCNSLSAGGGVLGYYNGGKFTGSILLEGLVFQDCHALATPFYSGDFESKFAFISGGLRGLFYPNSGGLALFGQVGGVIEISNTSFHRCSALSINGWGGGLSLGGMAFGLSAARILLKGLLTEHCASMLGGGIFMMAFWTPVSIEDTVIRNNDAFALGGGLAIWPGPPIRVGPNVSILSNTALAGGGGVALYSSTMIMGAYGNSLGVEVKGNLAMGELNISESGWIKKIQNPAVKSSSLSSSGQGGGILVLSTSDNGPSHLELLPGVSIVGNTAGCGGGIALATAQPVLVNSPRSTLTASGSTAAPVIIADNTAVTKVDAINFKLIINSFKIAGGDPDVPWGDGGGLWAIDSSSITFKSQVTVRGNHAKRGGGISLNLASALVTDGAVFSQNVATTNGGAVSSLLGVSISATQTQFSQNSAGQSGGGLATDFDSRATLTDCALEQNVAASGGGGLLSTGDSSITLVMSLLVGNQAQKDGGGALVAGSATLTALGGSIASNSVGGDGGGLAVVESASFLAEGAEPLELRNNTAGQNGGAALFSSEGGVALRSQTVSIKYNSATRGGGICFLSKLELMGSAATQIQSNVASGMGGGLFGYGTFLQQSPARYCLREQTSNR